MRPPTIPETVRETVAAVETLTTDEGVMARAVAEKLALDKSTASRRLRMAADGGYVCNLEDRRGKPGRWVVGDPMPEAQQLLPDPAQLRNPVESETAGQEGGCTVARVSEGYRGVESRPCTDCGEPATDISGLCRACIEARRS